MRSPFPNATLLVSCNSCGHHQIRTRFLFCGRSSRGSDLWICCLHATTTSSNFGASVAVASATLIGMLLQSPPLSTRLVLRSALLCSTLYGSHDQRCWTLLGCRDVYHVGCFAVIMLNVSSNAVFLRCIITCYISLPLPKYWLI